MGSLEDVLKERIDEREVLLVSPRSPRRPRQQGTVKDWVSLILIIVNIFALYWCYRGTHPNSIPATFTFSEDHPTSIHPCPAPLPTIFAQHPPSSEHLAIKKAKRSFDQALTRFYRKHELDSVAVAVVTSAGSVYEGFRGPLRANETDEELRKHVDRHSVFRIASISKMFASLETLILRNRGVLNLDDPIVKYIPELDYMTQAHSPAGKQEEVITFRQLMSHMAGLGREHPDGDASGHWPESLGLNGPPGLNGHPFPNISQILDAVSERHLIMTPYKFPSYSNTGFAILGAAVLAAARANEGEDAPTTYAELVKRDIFDKLGMDDSSFLSEYNKEHVVVPSEDSADVDWDLRAHNSAGGQMSSLSDLVTVAKSFLDPTSSESLLPQSSMLEWLRPVHNFWDGITSVGIPWEITRSKGPLGRPVEEYAKGGSFPGQFSLFTIVPTHSFVVVALTSSKVDAVQELHRLTMDHFLPAFDTALVETAERHLAGTWMSDDNSTSLQILMNRGSLFASSFEINGTDALITLNYGRKPGSFGLPIWALGNDEFRLLPFTNDDRGGCLNPWLQLDGYTYMNGYAVNLIRLLRYEDNPTNTKLEIPAMQMVLKR